MPLDVLGRTRATLTEPTSSFPCPEGLGNLVKLCRAGDRALQLLLFNEECLVSNSVNHRIFERTLRPLVFRGACLFERHWATRSAACLKSTGWDVIEGENPVCGRKGALYVAPSTSRVVWECSSKWEGRDCNQTCSRCSAGLLTGLLAALQASIVWCRWIRLEECSSLGSVIASCDAASAGRELAMRDEPNARLRCRNVRLSDTTKGVSSSRQQDGGHGSRNPLRSV
uniref:Uncharacterized protein n=1 Tax=Quercus lobata TaxID=97700 RepID=A0A7N2RFE5_QUELO